MTTSLSSEVCVESETGGSGDRDHFLDGTRIQGDVDVVRLVDLENNVLDRCDGEAGLLRRECIVGRTQERKPVVPYLVRFTLDGHIGVLVLEGQLDAGNHCARFVGDLPD